MKGIPSGKKILVMGLVALGAVALASRVAVLRKYVFGS